MVLRYSDQTMVVLNPRVNPPLFLQTSGMAAQRARGRPRGRLPHREPPPAAAGAPGGHSDGQQRVSGARTGEAQGRCADRQGPSPRWSEKVCCLQREVLVMSFRRPRGHRAVKAQGVRISVGGITVEPL